MNSSETQHKPSIDAKVKCIITRLKKTVRNYNGDKLGDAYIPTKSGRRIWLSYKFLDNCTIKVETHARKWWKPWTWFPGLDVVFYRVDSAGANPGVYRPGNWEEYLQLAYEAALAEQVEDERRHEERRKKNKQPYGDVL